MDCGVARGGSEHGARNVMNCCHACSSLIVHMRRNQLLHEFFTSPLGALATFAAVVYRSICAHSIITSSQWLLCIHSLMATICFFCQRTPLSYTGPSGHIRSTQAANGYCVVGDVPALTSSFDGKPAAHRCLQQHSRTCDMRQ